MEHIMRENGPMISLTEREDLFGRVVIGLREIGRTELLKMGYFPTMVVKCMFISWKEDILMFTGILIKKANGPTTSNKDLAPNTGLTAPATKASTAMDTKVDKAS